MMLAIANVVCFFPMIFCMEEVRSYWANLYICNGTTS